MIVTVGAINWKRTQMWADTCRAVPNLVQTWPQSELPDDELDRVLADPRRPGAGAEIRAMEDSE